MPTILTISAIAIGLTIGLAISCWIERRCER